MVVSSKAKVSWPEEVIQWPLQIHPRSLGACVTWESSKMDFFTHLKCVFMCRHVYIYTHPLLYTCTQDFSYYCRSMWERILGELSSLTVNHYVKGAVCSSNPIHFLSNSANVSSQSASCPFCVCAEKKSSSDQATQLVLVLVFICVETQPLNICLSTCRRWLAVS